MPLTDRSTPEHIKVTEFLARMIEAWPTLYTTRLDALERVFTSGDYEFESGAPLHRYPGETLGRDTTLDAPLDEAEILSDDLSPYNKLVTARKRRADALFVRENAAEIARAEWGDFHKFRSAPRFSTSRLNDIALDKLNPGWRAALVEYCKAIVYIDVEKVVLRVRIQGLNEEAARRDASAVVSSKETANECLTRLGANSAEQEEARRLAVSKVRQQAAALGFEITPMVSASA